LRRPDYEISYENMRANLLATTAVTTNSESYGDLLPQIQAAQETDFLAAGLCPALVEI